MFPPPSIRLSTQAEAVLRLAWAEGVEARCEPCGYLIGAMDPGGGIVVVRAQPGRNVHPRPEVAFRLDPTEHLAVRRAARAEELRVVGCWHGHLAGPARPSAADAEGLGPLGPFLVLIAGREGAEPPRLAVWWRGREPDEDPWVSVPMATD